jgi:hypothetical protein
MQPITETSWIGSWAATGLIAPAGVRQETGQVEGTPARTDPFGNDPAPATLPGGRRPVRDVLGDVMPWLNANFAAARRAKTGNFVILPK